MKPQRTRRFSLCSPKEIPLKEITEKAKVVDAMNEIRYMKSNDQPV